MRNLFVMFIAGVTALASAQIPSAPTQFPETKQSNTASSDSALKEMFEAKVKAEWEAIKNKDRKAYADLLADEYQGVEVDGKGERTKIQALNELAEGNISNYTLWGFKLIPLSADVAFVIYEVTEQFPPKSVVRYSRVYIGELWVKRAGQWKELHYQETHVK
ncbi:MAG TPA: nuclear transport factor 2 family protein [Terriglobales bacterium]|jgi:hypothetical protein|nr:nuclear transport factor 2 family protein [Terriglobales bacterium]